MRMWISAILILSLTFQVVYGESYDEFATKTVVIVQGSGYGTGSFISENFVLTANHVVKYGESAKVINRFSNYESQAKVIARDLAHDLAILQVSEPASSDLVIPVCDFEPVEGEQFIIAGYPAEQLVIAQGDVYRMTPTAREGHVIAVVRNGEYFQSSIDTNPGNSGGPVISLGGDCILGVVSFAYKANSKLVHPAFFMTSSKAINNFLSSKNLNYKKVNLRGKIERNINVKVSFANNAIKYLLLGSFFITILVIFSFKYFKVLR